MRVSAIFLLALSVYTAAADLTQSAYLDVQEKFYIEWQYTDTNITILAKVKTTGWFGIGFSPNGGMAGADIITASVVNGKAVLQDRFAERNGYPTVDSSQDVQLISGSEVNGVTTIKFTRKHNTCDDKDLIVGLDTMRLIWAISPDGSDTLAYHTPFNRGTRSVYLRRKLTLSAPVPDDVITIDIGVDNVEVDAHHTMYYCEVMRAPKLDGKHHLIKVEPMIEKANLGLVHHAILYGCYDSVDREHYFEKKKIGYDCLNNINMPRDLQKCRTPIFAWGIGGGDTTFPAEAGYPLGDVDSPDYFFMEMHYDNPKLLSGIRDSSAFRMVLTKQLRLHDAAILTAGGVFGIAVPPKVKDFHHSGYCSGLCTKKKFDHDMNVFGAFLHGHLAATQIIARQFRNGKELRTIDEDRHYDFNYQQYKMLETPLEIKPGDDVMVTCHYNTEDRVNMTYGGLPSSSEMCIAFLSYYPASKLNFCYSLPHYSSWGQKGVSPDAAFEFARKELNYNYKGANSSNFYSLFNEITEAGMWTEERINKLQTSSIETEMFDYCMDQDFFEDFKLDLQKFTSPVESRKPAPKRDYEKECSKANSQPDSVIG